MDADTRQALEESIEKWEINTTLSFGERRTGRRDCPLCTMFANINDLSTKHCKKCPVYQRTGERYCDGSPYEELAVVSYDYMYGDETADNVEVRWKKVAEKEVEFLKSLRPKEKE